jgi:hypothetical protein
MPRRGTASAVASNGTCMTEPSSGWRPWHSHWRGSASAAAPTRRRLPPSPRLRRNSSGRSTSCASSRAESIRRSSPRRACPRRWSLWRNGPPFPSGLRPASTHGCPSRSRPWPTSWCRNPWRTSRNTRAPPAHGSLQRDPARRDRGRRGRWGRREPGLRPARAGGPRLRGARQLPGGDPGDGGNPCPSRDPLRHLNRPADGDPPATPGAAARDHLTARPRTPGIDVTFRKGGSSDWRHRSVLWVRVVGALGATFRGTCAARTFRGAGRYRGCDR